MSRLWALAVGVGPIVLAFVACGGSGSSSVTQAGAGRGGAGLAGGGAAHDGGAGLGGNAGQATSGGGGQAASASPGGAAAGGAVAMGGSNVGGKPGSAGAQSIGGGWIEPATPGEGWTGPQDPACPATAVMDDGECAVPPGTRCTYAVPNSIYTDRCQCYTSSTGAGRWWCEQTANFGWDSCPVAFPGDGPCPNIGDVTCFYVDDMDKLRACNCAGGTTKCFPWGL